MMKDNNFSNEFNHRNESEFNSLVDESNSSNYDNDFSCSEKNVEKIKPKKHNLMFKLISSFIVVCAMAAMIQTTFEIPIFSRIFGPPQSAAEVVSPTCSLVFDGVNEEIPYGTDGHYKYPSHEKIGPSTWADYRYLHVHINFDVGFPEYEAIYFKMINVTEAVHTETSTLITKALIEDGSYFSPQFSLDAPQQSLRFMVYVKTDNPDNFKYTDTFSPDGSIIYYLIYTYTEVVIF